MTRVRRSDWEQIRYDVADGRDERRVESEPWPFAWTPPGPDPATNRRLLEENRERIRALNEQQERERARMVRRLDVPHVNGATLGALDSERANAASAEGWPW